MFLSVIIPAFNEEVRLPITLTTTLAYLQDRFPGDFEILVVDDGSTDGTVKIVEEFQIEYPMSQCTVTGYGGNRGKGYAVRHGMLMGQGNWRLFCDADLSTPIEEFDVVYDAMQAQSSEIGIGSRPLSKSHLLVHQPPIREFLGRTFNKAVQMLAVPGISDTQCGFKIFGAQAAQDIFTICKIDGFAFDVEALFIAKEFGYDIAEVPIRWSHKDGSKVSMFRDGFKMLRDMILVRGMHRNLKKKRRK